MKALVIFYSRTGTTKRVAGLLADSLRSQGVEATVRPVITQTRLGIISCIRQMMTAASPALTQPVPDTSGYDLVFLGFPVWADRPASPVNSILLGLNAPARQKFALFATSGGKEGYKASLNQVSNRLEEIGHEVVATRGFLRRERLPLTEQAAGEFAGLALAKAGLTPRR